LEAALALSVTSLVIAVFPFRRIAGWASTRGIVTRPSSDHAGALRVAQAIESWGRRLPWKTVCFQKGLALHWMLRRRGISTRLHYGVGHSSKKALRAHVWISVGGEIVMGGEVAHEFTCLAVFPSQPANAVH